MALAKTSLEKKTKMEKLEKEDVAWRQLRVQYPLSGQVMNDSTLDEDPRPPIVILRAGEKWAHHAAHASAEAQVAAGLSQYWALRAADAARRSAVAHDAITRRFPEENVLKHMHPEEAYLKG